MRAVCEPLPGQAVCHPRPIFGPVSTPCPLCCGFTTAAAAAVRREAVRLDRRLFPDAA